MMVRIAASTTAPVPGTPSAAPGNVSAAPCLSYVLVTPARNEEATIETTINSVVVQTSLPREWIVVSDGSTDRTDAIVEQYAARHPFIRLLRLDASAQRSFASVVLATEAGIKALQFREFGFLGLLDADVRFAAGYFQSLLNEFALDPQLGLAGGLVQDVIDGQVQSASQDPNEVAGATQFFRRECFESLGGLLPIPEGGWDAVTCIRARMNGFKTRTFLHLLVDHLKPRNAAFGNPLNRNWQMGMRDYALASHPLFEIVKCCSRLGQSPFIAGSIARLTGYFWSGFARRKQILPPDLRERLRSDQMRKLSKSFRSLIEKSP